MERITVLTQAELTSRSAKLTAILQERLAKLYSLDSKFHIDPSLTLQTHTTNEVVIGVNI